MTAPARIDNDSTWGWAPEPVRWRGMEKYVDAPVAQVQRDQAEPVPDQGEQTGPSDGEHVESDGHDAMSCIGCWHQDGCNEGRIRFGLSDPTMPLYRVGPGEHCGCPHDEECPEYTSTRQQDVEAEEEQEAER